MLRFCTLLLAGAYSLVLTPQLPGPIAAACIAIVSLLSGLHRLSRPIGVFLLGWLVSWSAANQLPGQQLDPALAGKTLVTRVRIAEFVESRQESARFVAAPESSSALPAKIRLTWFGANPRPTIGESWELRVRLRAPRGFSNPGGFDYENWLFRSSIGATGYVLDGRKLDRGTADAADRIIALRARIAARLRSLLPPDEARAVLMAITIGAKHEVSTDAWSRYARTGTSHLMAISGLHIGLAGGVVFALAWALGTLLLPRANQRMQSMACVLPAVAGYAAVSGLAIPAQRAALMALLAVAATLLQRPLQHSRQLALVCLVTVVANPLVIWAPGFQLSFAAVAILLQSSNHWCSRHDASGIGQTLRYRAAQLWSVQVVLFFGLFGLTAMLFERASLLAPAVNLIVLPIFGIVSVPAALAGLLLAGPAAAMGDLLLHVAHRSIALAAGVIEMAAMMPASQVSLASLSMAGLVAAFLGCTYTFMPRGWPGRQLALVGVAVAIVSRPQPLPVSCMELSVLDVGQGMSVVLRSGSYTVVFDTGPRFRSGTDAARLVTVPFLDFLAERKIDLLMVSHADLDHAGGATTLLAAKTIGSVVTGEAIPALPDATRCRAGQTWRFGQMHLRVLHPQPGSAWSGNNASCVLMVQLAEHRMLLTGDIESPVERLLTPALENVDVVVVPHHGSNTSSSLAFVQALRPRLALVSAGFGNRWGLPTPAVVDRWHSVGAEIAITANGGALSQRYCRGQEPGNLRRNRVSARRFWTQPLRHGIR